MEDKLINILFQWVVRDEYSRKKVENLCIQFEQTPEYRFIWDYKQKTKKERRLIGLLIDKMNVESFLPAHSILNILKSRTDKEHKLYPNDNQLFYGKFEDNKFSLYTCKHKNKMVCAKGVVESVGTGSNTKIDIHLTPNVFGFYLGLLIFYLCLHQKFLIYFGLFSIVFVFVVVTISKNYMESVFRDIIENARFSDDRVDE